MSIQTELDRIIGLVHESHEKAQAKGGTTATPLLANLPGVIESIPQGVELPTLTNPGSASDLLSGKQLINADGNVVTGNIATKTASNLSASGATVTVPAGYYASQASKSVATATQATPSISVSSAGVITASATQSAGYVASGTKSATKQLTTQAAKTITPSTSQQTAVASGRYTTGAVTVAPIPSSYVQPSGTLDITENGTHDVKNYESVNVNVASSGGSGGVSVETCTMTIKSDCPVTAYCTLYRDGRITKDFFPVPINRAQTFNDVIKNTLMFVVVAGVNCELDDYTGDGFYCIDTGTNWAVFTVWDYASTDDCYCELSWICS